MSMTPEVNMNGLVIEVTVYPAATIDTIPGLSELLATFLKVVPVQTVNDARALATGLQPKYIRIAEGPQGDAIHAIYDGQLENVLRRNVESGL